MDDTRVGVCSPVHIGAGAERYTLAGQKRKSTLSHNSGTLQGEQKLSTGENIPREPSKALAWWASHGGARRLEA